MSHSNEPTNLDPTLPPLLQAAFRHRKTTGYILLALAALFLVLGAYVAWKHQWDYAPVAAWAILVALSGLIAGIGLAFGETEDLGSLGNPRLSVLLLGGLIGFSTWLLSVSLAWKWRDTLLGGTEAWQGEHKWQLWVIALSMFFGLGITFASLLLARAVERTSPVLRRLLYGFNAALSGLLLLAVLMVLNIFVYNFVTASHDWTEASLYTLSDRSKNILKALDKPTKLYVIAESGFTSQELRTLMDNVREVNPKVLVEYLQPDRNRTQIESLAQQYPKLVGRSGLLVTYGAEGDSAHDFIKTSDIFANDPEARKTPGAQPRFLFKGEDALMTALNALMEGKKSTVYFLQGNGELNVSDTSAGQAGQGTGVLRERLEKANYVVKGLILSPVAGGPGEDPHVVSASRVPADASMVIVAGPRRPLPETTLKALHEYMNPADDKAPKGKMVLFLDLVLDAGGNLVRTGLEDFVGAFNVEVGNERIINLQHVSDRQGPLAVMAILNPRGSNPVSTALGREIFTFSDLRPIRPRTTPPGAPPAGMQAEPFLIAPGLRGIRSSLWILRQYLVLEKNLRSDPQKIADDLWNQLKADGEKVAPRLAAEEIPLAVAVSEPTGAPRPDDPHAFMNRDSKPRLVVFGTSSLVTNANIQGSSVTYPLIQSTLAWFADKPASIGLEPKRRNIYQLEAVTDEQESRMKLLPALMIYLGILGLGTGVWIVRRR